MAQPTFNQLRQLRNKSYVSPNLKDETIRERWLTCLAIIASNQNPDGTTA